MGNSPVLRLAFAPGTLSGRIGVIPVFLQGVLLRNSNDSWELVMWELSMLLFSVDSWELFFLATVKIRDSTKIFAIPLDYYEFS